MFIIRYYIGRILLSLALEALPDCAYKTELVRRIYELKYEAEYAYYLKHKGEQNGKE